MFDFQSSRAIGRSEVEIFHSGLSFSRMHIAGEVEKIYLAAKFTQFQLDIK